LRNEKKLHRPGVRPEATKKKNSYARKRKENQLRRTRGKKTRSSRSTRKREISEDHAKKEFWCGAKEEKKRTWFMSAGFSDANRIGGKTREDQAAM